MISEDCPAKDKKTPRKAECSQCGGLRNCDIVGQHDERVGDDDFQWHTAWYLLQCRGCHHVFVQTVSTNSEDYENDYGPDGETLTEYNETVKYWPALSKRKRPEWMSEAGIDADNVAALDEALAELYGALNNDLNMLAAIGIRTSIHRFIAGDCHSRIPLPLRGSTLTWEGVAFEMEPVALITGAASRSTGRKCIEKRPKHGTAARTADSPRSLG